MEGTMAEAVKAWLRGNAAIKEWMQEMTEAFNQAPRKALGSSKALRCQWVYCDARVCREEIEYTEGDENIEAWVELESGVGLWVCSQHRDLMRRIRQLKGDGMVRQMIGLSESGKQVWERNYFYALGLRDRDSYAGWLEDGEQVDLTSSSDRATMSEKPSEG